MEKYCRKCNILLVCNINTYSPQDKILDKICRDCDNRESKIREQKRKEKDPVFKEKLYLRQQYIKIPLKIISGVRGVILERYWD